MGGTLFDMNDWAESIHEWAKGQGFWDHAELDDTQGLGARDNPSIVPEKLMLIVTEVAEVMEGFRDGDSVNVAEELADVIIRVFDLCAHLEIDIDAEIAAKMKVNAARPHMHGKRC